MAEIQFLVDENEQIQIVPEGASYPPGSDLTFRNASVGFELKIEFDAAAPFSDFELASGATHTMNVGNEPGTYGVEIQAAEEDARDPTLTTRTTEIHVDG